MFTCALGFFQLDSLQTEAERLQEEKPEEAAIIRDKITQLTELWQDLKQMVSNAFLTTPALRQLQPHGGHIWLGKGPSCFFIYSYFSVFNHPLTVEIS